MRRGIVFLLAVAAVSTGIHSQSAPQATGAVAAWERLQKLRTTVSVMHITAHPDDEHGGVLAKLSRGDGARVTMLTLNRGESGDNAIGPHLFDALGLIRTEELAVANRYYGVDQQYFTTMVDYGFSKRLEESLDKWDRQALMRDVVRIVRMERPTIILSRFQGNERDGHGNHQAAGVMAMAAFEYAGDPAMFPDQIEEGLRPWRPIKGYIGGVRENEDWTVRIDSGEYSAVLGDSYGNVARMGLAYQRSQTGGRTAGVSTPNFYKAIGAQGARERTIYDALPTTMEATIGAAGKGIDQAVEEAIAQFRMVMPWSSARPLARGLRLTREAMAAAIDPQTRHILGIKEQQFQDAINAAVAAHLIAVTNPPLMPAPVPGQTFGVDVQFAARGGLQVEAPQVSLVGERGWRVTGPPFRVTLADDVALSTKPYFHRNGLQESRYTLTDPSQFGRPFTPAPLMAAGLYMIDGVQVELRTAVTRRESKVPYGEVLRVVRTVPRIALTSSPSQLIVPMGTVPGAGAIEVQVQVLHNADTPSTGQLVLRLPDGWVAKPASQAFGFTRAGERAAFRFAVTPKGIGTGVHEIEAVAIDGLGEYRQGYELIDQRDLELQYLYRDATTAVRGVNVTTVAGLKVGYVMGIGDQVPPALQQLGATVTLLGEKELASADLSAYDTIMTGTRAYAVRDDLKTYNARLLDYVKAGGNMIVLYNTQELAPNTFAPFPGELPRTAEEVSEEDSPVTILARNHQAFNWPNRITPADFDGWVEQRGSKFFTKWDAAYTPMISTFDKGQPPQSGGWLTANVGKGKWTYFAYALHRQLPYGVAGAYRITANLLALNKQPVGGNPRQ